MREQQYENLLLKMEISRLHDLLASSNLPQSPATAVVSDATIIIPTQSTSAQKTVVSEDTIVIPSSQETIVFFKNPHDISDRHLPTTTATAEVVAEGSASIY